MKEGSKAGEFLPRGKMLCLFPGLQGQNPSAEELKDSWVETKYVQCTLRFLDEEYPCPDPEPPEANILLKFEWVLCSDLAMNLFYLFDLWSEFLQSLTFVLTCFDFHFPSAFLILP